MVTPASTGGVYSTTFPADEDPISEGGAWDKNASNAWQHMKTTGGHAQAAAYTEAEDDAYAYLKDFPSNDYEIVATIRYTGINSGEAEVLLRVSDTSSTVKAIEMLVNTSGSSLYIVRWNGAQHSFDQLSGPHNAGFSGVDGMQMKVRIQGTTINAWLRASSGDSWIQVVTNYDGSSTLTNHTTGKPGMAVYVHASSSNIDNIGFHDYTVTPV